MTNYSSEYTFPIFISSTVYNLIDLRAELSKYLTELGYKPILSSSEGFHDYSPKLAPWESCLEVLNTSYLMILIIDNKYGNLFEWSYHKDILGDEKISPTHAEYRLAHKSNLRMLVFIRKELLTYYQIYRSTLKKNKENKIKTKKELKKIIPDNIDYETLEFIKEVKTSTPIPWIRPFENVTEIKSEIQKKMLNELAITFLIKNAQKDLIIFEFSKILDDLPEEKRIEILNNIGVTKELITDIDIKAKEIIDLKNYNNEYQKELLKVKDQLSKEQKKQEKEALNHKIDNLNSNIVNINKQILIKELSNVNYLLSGSLNSNINNYPSYLSFINSPETSVFNSKFKYLNDCFCEKCKSIFLKTDKFSLITCNSCKRNLCNKCFYGDFQMPTLLENASCLECKNK